MVDHFLAQAPAVQQLHHEERTPFGIEVVVENRDDVRMTKLRAGAALAEEALTRAGIGPEVGPHDLHGDLVAEQRPARAIDRPHPALGDGGDNLVAAVQDRPDGDHRMILTGLGAGTGPILRGFAWRPL